MAGVPARLILVRHGRTAKNAEGRFQGHDQTELDAVGEAQAAALAGHFSRLELGPVNLHASDLPRAVQTAGAIGAALQLPVTLHPDLREIDVGCWGGQTFSDLQGTHPDLFAGWLGGHPDFRCPGGESFDEVGARLMRHIQANVRDSQTLMLVTHGVAISAALSELLHLDFQGEWVSRALLHLNTAYSVLDLDPDNLQVIASQLNQAPHLASAAAAPRTDPPAG